MKILQVTKVNAVDRGGCNFCRSNVDGAGLTVRTYTEVTVLQGDGVFVRICDDCRTDIVKALGGAMLHKHTRCLSCIHSGFDEEDSDL